MNFGLRSLLSLVLVFFVSETTWSQDLDQLRKQANENTKAMAAEEPQPATADAAKEPEWNRWTSDSFVVHAITNDKGKYLKNNLENIKTWILERWGLHQFSFGKETVQTKEGPKQYSHVKLWCMDNPTQFKDHFGIEDSKVEVIRDSDGGIKNIEVFLLLNDSPAADIPIPLTEAVLAEFETLHNTKFSWWAYRGMGLLNGTIPQIKKNLIDLGKKLTPDAKIYLSKSLLTMTKEDWEGQNPDNRELFDQESACLCLLLRKEFGQLRMMHFLNESQKDPEKALKKIYEFKNYDQFNASFYRYMAQLAKDIDSGKTPNDYLNVKRAVK